MIEEGRSPSYSKQRRFLMNCLCHLFDDSTLWVIIIAVILLALFCNGNGCGCYNSSNNGCGCGCN